MKFLRPTHPYVATCGGLRLRRLVIDAYARRIVGWRVSRTAHASFVLDALEQALHDRRPAHRGGSYITATAAARQIQVVVATGCLLADRRSSSSASAGVLHSSVLRGRVLRAVATAAISSALCTLRSVPFGKY